MLMLTNPSSPVFVTQHCIVSGWSHSDVMPVFVTQHCIVSGWSQWCDASVCDLALLSSNCFMLKAHSVIICCIVLRYTFTIPIPLLWYTVLSPSISSQFQYCYCDILYCRQVSLHCSHTAVMICCFVFKFCLHYSNTSNSDCITS